MTKLHQCTTPTAFCSSAFCSPLYRPLPLLLRTASFLESTPNGVVLSVFRSFLPCLDHHLPPALAAGAWGQSFLRTAPLPSSTFTQGRILNSAQGTRPVSSPSACSGLHLTGCGGSGAPADALDQEVAAVGGPAVQVGHDGRLQRCPAVPHGPVHEQVMANNEFMTLNLSQLPYYA